MVDEVTEGSPEGEVTEVSNEGWFSRIAGALWSILIGIVVVLISGVVLFWNEGRAVHTAASLSEGASLVVSVAPGTINPANDGKLVHVAGPTASAQDVTDADFGFSVPGLALRRTVEMYQWSEKSATETRKTVGGGEEKVTRYTYERDWASVARGSGGFKEPQGHENPPFPTLSSTTVYGRGATLGAFALPERVLSSLIATQSPTLPASAGSRSAEYFGTRTTLTPGFIYAGASPGTPKVGDVRVTYASVPVAPISIVARQTQSTFAPYVTRNGREILLVAAGEQDAASMFKGEQDANQIFTWILRVVGMIAMVIGFRMMLNLLSVLGDLIPIVGDIIGAGAWLVALTFTVVLAPLIIAVAWLVFRPFIAFGVIALAIAILFGIRQVTRRNKVSPEVSLGTS